MNVILLGAPGSGKGTEAKFLSASAGLRHVSTGDIFRAEIAARTELGIKAEEFISRGCLVPDSITMGMVKSRLAGERKGLLFDGFPRSIPQAEGLTEWFSQTGRSIDAVIYLDVPDDVIIDRIVSRRTCVKCGKIYNLKTLPPKKDGICDICGSQLSHRSDDNEEIIRQRLISYKQLTEPLIGYYKNYGVFFRIEASGTPQHVHEQAMSVLGIK